MLGKPDKEMRREKLDPMRVPDMSRESISGDDIMYIGKENSSFLSDSVNYYSPGRKFVPKQPANIERNRRTKENVYTREVSSIKNQKSRYSKVRFRCKSGYVTDIEENEQFHFNVGEIITSPQEPLGIDSSPPGPEVPKLQFLLAELRMRRKLRMEYSAVGGNLLLSDEVRIVRDQEEEWSDRGPEFDDIALDIECVLLNELIDELIENLPMKEHWLVLLMKEYDYKVWYNF